MPPAFFGRRARYNSPMAHHTAIHLWPSSTPFCHRMTVSPPEHPLFSLIPPVFFFYRHPLISVNQPASCLPAPFFSATFLLLQNYMLPRPLNGLDDWILSKGFRTSLASVSFLADSAALFLLGGSRGWTRLNNRGRMGLIYAARCRGSRAARCSFAPGAPLRSPLVVVLLLSDVHRPLFLA